MGIFKKEQKRYSWRDVDNLIKRYTDEGGQAIQLSEGVLQSGNWVLYDPECRLCAFVIKEVYVNGWTSEQTIRRYNKLPKNTKSCLNSTNLIKATKPLVSMSVNKGTIIN